jgi:Leucine-rich repeat (LRR) protein
MTLAQLNEWWNNLEPQWKRAFNQCVFNQGETEDSPSDKQLKELPGIEVMRFVGPTGPFPNLSFELTNLSGLAELTRLNLLVLNYHQVESMVPLAKLTRLKTLYMHNNQIRSLHGIEGAKNLQGLFVQSNKLVSVRELEGLLQLKEVYLNDNQLTSLEGITAKHEGKLENLFALPNPIGQREIMRIEREVGVRCRRL